MKWRYKGQADIIFGEVKPSPVPKIMLAVIISIVVLSGISCFLLRNYIYDLAFNPHVELNLTQENDNYYIDLVVNSEFNLYDYIDESRTLKYDKFISDNNKYVCEVEGEIDTSKVGEYPITYKSSNRIRSQEIPVTIRVSDNEAPTIELTKHNESIECTDEAIKTFNPEDYIKEAKDNYYDVLVEYHIYDNETEQEISIEDIYALYEDITDLDNLKDDDIQTWITNHTNAVDKYSNLEIESERLYRIEYTVTENSESKLSDTSELLLTITFNKNTIISILNSDYDELQLAIEQYNADNPTTVITVTKPTDNSGDSNKPSGGSGNSGNNDKPSNGGGGSYTYKCPVCGAVYNNVDDANRCATTHFDD